MTSERSPDVSPYVADIRDQPEALTTLFEADIPAATRALLADLDRFDRIVMTGMGASLHAMYPAYLRLAAAGMPVWCEETAELLGIQHGLTTASTLLWVASQSGESAEVAELLDRLAAVGGPVVLGVTNDVSSSLADGADEVLPLHSGPEHTVGTRSYLNTLAAMALATNVALASVPEGDLRAAPQVIHSYLEDWDGRLADIDRAVPGPPTFVLGRGPSLGSARAGALVIKEAARCAVEGMSVPQFRHGPLEIADSGITVLLMAGVTADRGANESMRDNLVATGARCVWVSPDAHAEPTIAAPALTSLDARPLGEIVPAQLLSVVLARRQGTEPGSFRHVDKVTRTL